MVRAATWVVLRIVKMRVLSIKAEGLRLNEGVVATIIILVFIYRTVPVINIMTVTRVT